jgi:hypothetical protein
MNLHTHTKDFTALITFAAAHFNITENKNTQHRKRNYCRIDGNCN